MSSLLSILVLGLAAAASAQEIMPTNIDIPPLAGGKQQRLDTTGYRPGPLRVAPLTSGAGIGKTPVELDQTMIPGPNMRSRLRAVDAGNVNMLTSGEMAYISCDAMSGNPSQTPSEVVAAAARLRPDAIVLYSMFARSCNISGDFGYQTIYTMTSPDDGRRIFSVAPVLARITSDAMTGNGPPNNNNGGPAPTTAVAMSILYAITGIITLLFLIIIATGAIRAHRNPDRYGPRRALGGRTRQSRAKGLARAMLETIPIVKFGDPEPAKAGSARDVELADANTTPAVATKDAEKTEGSTESDSKTLPVPPVAAGAGMESGMGTAESIKSAEEAAKQEGAVECSICTESFSTGDDVRVLPCDHKFHPACIDPWLLNVSGTCPLCRHDLNPHVEGEGEGEATPEGTELPPPLAEPEPETAPQRRRMSRFLDPVRMRTAPPAERIAALRQLREESRVNDAEGSREMQAVEEPSRQRLRDRLRIGGRSQQPSTPADSAPPPPSAPSANETPR